MPRKQLDILKDMFIAHNKNDEEMYQKNAGEFIKYLRWKGWKHKAEEFTKILLDENLRTTETSKNSKRPELFSSPIKKKQNMDRNISKNGVWQVSGGANINFIQAHHLIEELIKRDRDRYTNKVIAEIIGYSIKKTQGFTRLLYYLGLLEDRSKKPTKLAFLIREYDPYFEDIGTLWLLHYYISSQPRLIIWNGLANNLFNKPEFYYNETAALFKREKEKHSDYSFKHHLRKEFKVITEAYTNSELQNLNLFTQDNRDHFIKTTSSTIPDDIILSGILLFKKRNYSEESTLEIKNLINKLDTPGRLFYLSEHKFRQALERLRKKDFITIESFANLDQIKFVKTGNYLECLQNYYKNKLGE